MSEILVQAGSELSIVQNADGTYTACVRGKQRIFPDIEAAAMWACSVRDGERKWMS